MNSISITFYDGSGCSGTELNGWNYYISQTADWTSSWATFTTPSGTASALVGIISSYQYIDDLYVNTANQF